MDAVLHAAQQGDQVLQGAASQSLEEEGGEGWCGLWATKAWSDGHTTAHSPRLKTLLNIILTFFYNFCNISNNQPDPCTVSRDPLTSLFSHPLAWSFLHMYCTHPLNRITEILAAILCPPPKQISETRGKPKCSDTLGKILQFACVAYRVVQPCLRHRQPQTTEL